MKLTLALVLALFCLLPAQAQILLLINDSNPNSVTFTATNNAPSQNSTGSLLDTGIDLVNFFSGDESEFFQLDASSTLTTKYDYTGSGTQTYISANPDSYSSGAFLTAPYLDLSLTSGSDGNQTFNTNTAAFIGQATFDFAGNYPDGGYTLQSLSDLPALGTTGNIVAGNAFNSYFLGEGAAPVVGQWEVVPEPSAWTLLLGGLGWLVAWRLRTTRRA